jgi:hypothetical protein
MDSSPPPERKKHNKSSEFGLSFLTYTDEDIMTFLEQEAFRNARTVEGLIEGSFCKELAIADGRITSDRKKVAYGYQLVAFRKFGRAVMANIAASKSKNDTTISHLCGTRNCCEESHIILEPKGTNDERTHCHFCISNAKRSNGWNGVSDFFSSGACTHVPRCCSLA